MAALELMVTTLRSVGTALRSMVRAAQACKEGVVLRRSKAATVDGMERRRGQATAF
jgi:hypothetical protein